MVRKQAKDHGLGKLIEGTISPGERALIVDDVLTTGGSLIKAAEAARGAGLTVHPCYGDCRSLRTRRRKNSSTARDSIASPSHSR